VRKYAKLIAGKWTEGLAIDIYLLNMVRLGRLQAYVTVPFITAISPSSIHSDILGGENRSRRVFDIYRRAFFVEADVPALLAEMGSITKGLDIAPLVAL